MESFKGMLPGLDDVRTWIGGAAISLGGFWLKWRSDQRSELTTIIEQLRAECLRNEKFRVLNGRLANSAALQQLEIILRRKASTGALEELKIALVKIRAIPPEDCEEYLERAIRILEEEIVIPAPQNDQNEEHDPQDQNA